MTAPLCPACPHVLAIHGTQGCVAASGCGCKRAGLSLPLLATFTGGRTPDAYCPACLDRWHPRVPEAWRAGIHPTCREVLEAIRTAPGVQYEAS